MAGPTPGLRGKLLEGSPDWTNNQSGEPFGFYIADCETGEDLARSGQTGKGGPGAANCGCLGSAQTFQVSSVKLRGRGQSPSCYALTNAHRQDGSAYAVRPCAFFTFARFSGALGNFCSGVGRFSSRLAPDYLQKAHQRRVGVALSADCASRRCNSPICTSLASNCALSTSTSSFESLLGTSWASVGMSSGIATTHLPRTFRPLSTRLANLRRIVLTLTSRRAAASMIEMSMYSRIFTLSTRCLPKTHKLLTTVAA